MPEDALLAQDSAVSESGILTVSALVRSARDLLEHRYPLLWVSGEISNFALARSGHAYFILKDDQAQVRCVMFRHRHALHDWTPSDGEQVQVRALVTLYEPRGEFQLVVEAMRRAGRGVLFEAFLRLRERLAKEGLFDAVRKRPLPAYPRAIGVITSLDAAALRDVLTTLARRNPALPVVIYPSSVQGTGAAEAIARALAAAGRRGECDVLLLVRGGGSIEDLWAFNEETVARAIRDCPIPVVTGIGHETDFTIADFAADRRAPTPSAAAELVSPEREVLREHVARLASRLGWLLRRGLEQHMQHLDRLARALVHPRAKLASQQALLGQLRLRLAQAAARAIAERRWRVLGLGQRARAHAPRLGEFAAGLQQARLRLHRALAATLDRAGHRCARAVNSLSALDPLAVLARGYSIVEKANGAIVRDSAALRLGEAVNLRFAHGRARARIDAKQ